MPLLILWMTFAGLPAWAEAEVFRAERIQPNGNHTLEWQPRWTTPDRPTVALALSGGGPRGFAHLGVLLAMEEDGLEFDAIAGTSMGAIVGGFLAAGYSPHEIESIFSDRAWDDILTGLDQRRPYLTEHEEYLRDAPLALGIRKGKRLEVGALISTDRLQRELYRLFLRAQIASNGDFDRLRFPFRAVATDVLSGERVVADDGGLVTAIGGSAAVPGIFRPVRYQEHLLVDGLLVENLPVETAQTEFGLDLVVAVDAAEGVHSTDDIRGTFDVLNRSVNIVTQRRNQELRELADVLIAPETWRFPASSFDNSLDDLVTEGRASYGRARDALWRELLKRYAGSIWSVGNVEVSGTSRIDEDEIMLRLRADTAPVAELSARMELTRLLNNGPYRDGSLEVRHENDKVVLHYRFEEFPQVREVASNHGNWDEVIGEPYSPRKIRERIASIQRAADDRGSLIWESPQVTFDEEVGRLTVMIEAMQFGELHVESSGSIDARRTGRAVEPLENRPLVLDRLTNRLNELVDRGAIFHWSLTPHRTPEGNIDLTAAIEGDRFVTLAAGADYRSNYGFGGWGRVAKTNLTGRGDFIDLTIAGNTVRQIVETRYRAEYGAGRYALGYEFGLRYLDEDIPTIDIDQDILPNQDERRSGERAWLSVLHRPQFGGLFRFGGYHTRDRFKVTDLQPAEAVKRSGIEADWEWSGQNFLRFPDDGFKFRLQGTRSVSGPGQWRAQFEMEYAKKLFDKNVLVAMVAGGISDGVTRLPDTFDPGGYRDRYGWIPNGARSAQFATVGLRYRRLLTNLNLARIYVEAGVDQLATADIRTELDAATARTGYGIALTGVAKFIGPVSLGVFRNEDGAGGLFLTVGFESGN